MWGGKVQCFLLEIVPDDSHVLSHPDLKIGLPVFISTEKNSVRQAILGSSLGIQCLGHPASTAGDPGSVPDEQNKDPAKPQGAAKKGRAVVSF